MPSLTPLNNIAHKNLKVIPTTNYELIKNRHMMPVFVGEFVIACAEYPVAFVKDATAGQIQSVILTGLKPQQNLFYSKQGWLGKYAPVSVHNSPIVVVPNQEDSNQVLVFVHEDSNYVSDKEGQALFEENSEQSEYLNTQIEVAIEHRRYAEQTREFIETLDELKLFKSESLTVKPASGAAYNLNGLHIIDERRLSELTDGQFLELRMKGYLAPIYASLSSLHRLDHLLQRSSDIDNRGDQLLDS